LKTRNSSRAGCNAKLFPHNVLNAKYHEREAEIIAQAGRKGAVTIATNMAGRGTDILLGGNPDFYAREFLKKKRSTLTKRRRTSVTSLLARETHRGRRTQRSIGIGGLHILGTERHESRRIDNQLRGRAGTARAILVHRAFPLA